jgi:hypothetical protein
MARLTSLLLILSLLSGCSAFSRRHRGAAAGADAAAVAGAVLIAANRNCDDDWSSDDACQSEVTGYLVGHVVLGAALVAGAIILGDEAARRSGERTEIADAEPTTSAPQTDEVTLRLAGQAYRQSELGDCTAARTTLAVLARENPPYHAALVAQPVVASCR